MCAKCDELIAQAEARGARYSPRACGWVGPRLKYQGDPLYAYPTDWLLESICEDRPPLVEEHP